MFSIRRCGWHWVFVVGLLLQIGIVAAQEGQAPEGETPSPLALVKSGRPGVEVADTKRARVVELDPKLLEGEFSKGDQLSVEFFKDAACTATLISVEKVKGYKLLTATVDGQRAPLREHIDIAVDPNGRVNIKWRSAGSTLRYLIGYHKTEKEYYAVELLPPVVAEQQQGGQAHQADGHAHAAPAKTPPGGNGGRAVVFNSNNPITLEKMPAGSPLRNRLETLPPAVQRKALDELATMVLTEGEVTEGIIQVGTDGAPFYVCSGLTKGEDDAQKQQAQPTKPEVPPLIDYLAIPAPTIRHSKPGSPNRLYLDFTGPDVPASSGWLSATGNGGPWYCNVYSTDTDETTFSATEQTAILQTWAMTAEDFAPFDIDVTTENPGGDPNLWDIYTGWVVISTGVRSGPATPLGTGVGIAMSGPSVFGVSGYQNRRPAWCYEHTNPRALAATCSHEFGHNCSLNHDGQSPGDGNYYWGHGGWNAIMAGVNYSSITIVQWSKGEYVNPTNTTQDDLDILRAKFDLNGTGYRADDAGDTIATATPLTIVSSVNIAQNGIIETTGDPDVYSFTTGTGNITINATPVYEQGMLCGNLNIRLELRDGLNNLLASSNPDAAIGDTSANITNYNITNAGQYYVFVIPMEAPVGQTNSPPPPPGFYTIYGSLGQYSLSGTINPATGIVLTAPNGGEKLFAGQSTNVTWSTSETGNVKIELFKNGIKTADITTSTPASNKSFTWNIPANQLPGADYKVKITSLSDGTKNDESLTNFSILGVDVTYPDGGETLFAGSTVNVTWTAYCGGNVKIELFKNGLKDSDITTSTAANTGTFSWGIPANQAFGIDYKVKITSLSYATHVDQSQSDFTIAGMDITSPDGGESLFLNNAVNITWSSSSGGTVNIELWKGGVKVSDLFTGTANDGTEPWTPASTLTPGTDYKIRIAHTTYASQVDQSQSNFELIAVRVTVPAANERYLPGDSMTIAFQSYLGGKVTIAVYKNGVFDANINTNKNNSSSGTQAWTIPSTQPAHYYKIRVTWNTSPNPYGESGTFKILEKIRDETLDGPSNPNWPVVEGQWAWGTPTGAGGGAGPNDYGNPDPTSGHTGSYVYGYNLAGNYGASQSPMKWLRTAATDCTNYQDVTLFFWRWLNIEDNLYDHAYVQVSNNNTNWTLLWENGNAWTTDNAWSKQVLDMSAVGNEKATVYVRWGLSSDSSWQFSGWNIDDIVVAGFPKALTPVRWDTFAAYQQPGGVLLKWTCASELENAGYNVYRLDAGSGSRDGTNGGWTKLNPTLIPGRLTYAGPTEYGWFDFGGNASCEYRVESVSLKGATENYPGVVRPSGALLPPETGLYAMAVNLCSQYRATRAQDLTVKQNQARIGGAVAQGEAARVVARSEARGEVQGSKALEPLLKGPAMPAALRAAKVRTRGQGVVWVPASMLPGGLNPQQLEIFYEGRTIPVLGADSQGVALWAPGYEDAYTDVDAFFLVPSEGPTNALKPNNAKGLFSNKVVPQTVHTAVVEQSFHDVYYLWSSAMMPYSYPPWFSGNLMTDGTSYAYTLSTKNLSSGPGRLTVRLWSLNAGSHELGVSVNGTPVGVQGWTNGGAMLELSFAVPDGVLREGANTIELTTPNSGAGQISLLHGLILGYPQALVCEGPMSVNTDGSGSGVVEVRGLPGQKVWVVQVSAGSGVLVDYEVKRDGATYAIRWQYPLGVTARYYVVPAGMELAPLSVQDRVISPLQDRVAYLAVGKAALGNAVQPLLDARSAEGLNALFVDQERLFDAYGNGRFGPLGILRAVRSVQPQYLLLVGRSTYDYKNYMGLQPDTGCPTVLVATKHWGQTGSDGAYGEWDGAPQVAVGRLVQDDPAGVSNAVSKILAYRGAADSGRNAVVLADVPDPSAGDFHAEADELAAQTPEANWTLVKQGSGAAGDSATARTEFLKVVNGGADVAAFIGHGSSTKWANGTISTGNVSEWTGLPVVLAATCNGTYFLRHPQYPAATLAELLQGQPGGGTPAMIGSGTYTTSGAHLQFMIELLKRSGEEQRWGDALLKTRAWALSGTSELQDVGQSEQLLGDPALPVIVTPAAEKSVAPSKQKDAKF